MTKLTEQENGLRLAKNEGKEWFPLQPLILGGDDLTFVCEGRLGLPLAALYLQYFSKQKDSQGKPLSACAGVVIARSHFPLSRAYSLAEELCGNAKSKIKKKADTGEKEGTSWLDFQIIYSGITGQLDQIRDETPELYWRPWRVVETRKSDRHSWQHFKANLTHFRDKWARSQVKALREALAEGEGTTKQFLTQARIRNYTLHSSVKEYLSQSETGWENFEEINKTILNDPIEALDFYLEVENNNAN